MTVVSGRVTINTGAAQQIVANPAGAPTLNVTLKNIGAQTVALGSDSTVTTATGYDLVAGGTYGPVELEAGDEIFGATGTNGQVVEYIGT